MARAAKRNDERESFAAGIGSDREFHLLYLLRRRPNFILTSTVLLSIYHSRWRLILRVNC